MERRLSAIFAADMVGYSRLMEADEALTLARQKTHRKQLIDPAFNEYHGRIVKEMGDGILVEFPSVVEAVHCAVTIQRAMPEREASVPDDRRIAYRIGINLGDIVVEDDDIYGDGVNVAARLEALAEPGGICISGTAYDHLRGAIEVGYESLGEVRVKNIERPIRAYKVLIEPEQAGTVIEKAPQRFSTTRRSVAILVVLLLAGVLGGTWWWSRQPDFEPADPKKYAFEIPDKPSIAVLPFENLTGDPEQDYFANGITEDLTTALSRFTQLFVIAPRSSSAYDNGSPRKAAEALGVRYVLEGSVRSSPDRIRITAQLVDAISGSYAWAERYDRRPESIFAVQDEIVERIAGTLGGPNGRIELEERARATHTSAPNLTAYDYYLRGREAFDRFTDEGFAEARQYYRKAIDLDADFDRPYGGLAWVDILELKFGRSNEPKRTLERAEKLAQKAAALNPEDYVNHWSLGTVYMWKRQHAQAIAEYERALSLNPNNANLNAEMADALTFVGRADESIELAKNAIRLNPNYPDWYLWNLAAGYFLTGEYENALGWLLKMGNPGDARRLFAATYAQLGLIDEARAEAAKLLQINPDFSIARWAATQPYQDPRYFAPYVEGLRKAGLPE